MKIPKEMKIDTNMAVVFKKPFMLPKKLGSMKCNAIVQQDDGSLFFFNTDYMKTSGKVRVAYKDINGGLQEVKNE
jgi:hypothetical protein